MPKERPKRSNAHDQSARLNKRQFILSDRAEHVEVGAEEDLPAMDILNDMVSTERPNLKKKEKQQLKHDNFLQRLESSHTPYSKSHTRRLKRKAKEEIGNGLQSVALALPTVENELKDDKELRKNPEAMDSDSLEKPRPSRKPKVGQIGEGKGVTLSEKQRRQVLKLEKARQPLLLATPEFTSNPFGALRIHAQNTLVKHEK